MEVTLIDKMGNDLSVVNAARVSYSKTKKTFEQSDEKLIKYLAEHEHWSPFAHASMQFRIKAPIFVARQLVKHQVGLVWNEVSRRYVDHAPELYRPDSWRGRPQNSKQGSDGEVELDQTINHNMETTMESCLILYNSLLQKGVAPEQARMVLPQSMMTEWYWSGTLYAFARVCNLRCKPDTQKETQDVANEIDKLADKAFPLLLDVFEKMSWFDKILIGTLGGYMAYVFVLATINTICDCI
jgi:thymidylate synthase (FAD)